MRSVDFTQLKVGIIELYKNCYRKVQDLLGTEDI